MNLWAGVFAAIWLGVIPCKNSDMALNFDDTAILEPKAIISTTEYEDELSDEEFDLLARCVEAEAGDQGYLGKCYVVDCILNRRDQWNKSIHDVIYQPKQFEVVSNNRINTVEVTEETRQAVRDELKCRTNSEILFFCMYRWFDDWAEYLFTYPENRPNNCHHFYK